MASAPGVWVLVTNHAPPRQARWGRGWDGSILAADAETPPADTGDDLVLEGSWSLSPPAQLAQVLHAGHLVTGRAVIFGDFRLNNHLGGELVGHNEIGNRGEPGI